MKTLFELLPCVAIIAIMASLLWQRISDADAMFKRLENRLSSLSQAAPVGGKILGGWWIADDPRPRVVARIRCQAPRMDLYRENFNCRRRLPTGTED